MKAIVQLEYGAPVDVLSLQDIDKPVVRDDDVLVRVHASSANPWDWHFIRGEPLFMRLVASGIRKPKFKVAGGDLAGTVEDIGGNVQAFKPGDEVCGFGHGAFAEYIAVPHGSLMLKPTNLTFEQAAAVPLAAVTALQGLREHGRIESGQKVLVVGASGGVGTFAVQIAKALGAEVTSVCSTNNVELVRQIGADGVIDYTSEDFTGVEGRYDLVLQLGGTYSPSAIRRVLTPKGILIQSYGDGGRWFGPLGNIIKAVVMNPFVGQTLKSFTAEENTETLESIKDLIESGKVSPVVDSSYPLSEAGAAVRLVEEGSPQGKVVITV